MRQEDAAKVTAEVTHRVVEDTLTRANSPGGQPIEEVINETLYHEFERLKTSRTPLDEEDRSFYKQIQHHLPKASQKQLRSMLTTITDRYVHEILGNFNPRVYSLTTRALPTGLALILNSITPRRLLQLRKFPTVDDHLVIRGEIDLVKKLQTQGTLIFTPTHTSNLDSVLLGYSIYKLGLPPVIYGAGLNLFKNPIMSFFMHNLGAYTVDRRKRDPLYRNTLKTYACACLENGYDSLYFPGGTRSRSGVVETKLKRGLLGTAITAYRNNLLQKKPHPRLFIIPVTISYPLVLEANSLIKDYLKRSGKTRYIIPGDEFDRWRRWVDFLRGIVSLDTQIKLTIGQPLDPFGNDIDEQGRSLDPARRVIDPSDYMLWDGELVADEVRDREYTTHLAARLVERLHQNNVAMAENVVAFAFFERLRRDLPQSDLYRFLRSLSSFNSLSIAELEQEVDTVCQALMRLEANAKIRLSSIVQSGDSSAIVARAMQSFQAYHAHNVLERQGDRIHMGDQNLLLYYRNRLDGYNLLGVPNIVKSNRRPR